MANIDRRQAAKHGSSDGDLCRRLRRGSGHLRYLESAAGRIFALLYLQPQPMALDDIATHLEQSKSNISVNIRGLLEWHLVRRVPVGGSRKDHYEAATDFWRLMQEILERRHRFSVRQVLTAVDESVRAGEQGSGGN